MFLHVGNTIAPNLPLFGIAIGIVIFSYIVTIILAPRIKATLIHWIHNRESDLKSKNFLFKIELQSIAPILFVTIAFVVATIVSHHIPFLGKKQFLLMTLITSFILKIGTIWFIYRIASLSSANQILSKVIAIALLFIIFFDFLGLYEIFIKSLEVFRANFGVFEISVYKIFLLLMIILGAFWFNKVVLETTDKILDTTQMSPNAKVLFIKIFGILFFIAVFLIGLWSIGFDLTSLAIFSSALAVGLGFGFQKIVSNYISGIAISAEGIIKEGDIIEISDKKIAGIVKDLHMTYVCILEYDGKETMISNDTIVTSNISNLTHSNNRFKITIVLPIPHTVDLTIFRQDIVSLMNKNPYASKIEESVFHIDAIHEFGIMTILFFWIDNPSDSSLAKTSLLLDIMNYMKEKDISMPRVPEGYRWM